MNQDLHHLLIAWSDIVGRARYRHDKRDVPPSVVATGSVLVPGATVRQVDEAETRLGVVLPPSYRQFLLTSNGAYGGDDGLQTKYRDRWWHERQPLAPQSLLPVEEIGFAGIDDPVSLDLWREAPAGTSHGQTNLHEAPYRDEVAYLAAPWLGKHVPVKRGQAYRSIRIGWVDDPATLLVLNPMVMDAAGEWELNVLLPDGDERYPSFEIWLESATRRQRERWIDPYRARSWLWDPRSSVQRRLRAVRDLLDLEPDLDWLANKAETALTPGTDPGLQRRAVSLLEWIDTHDGGQRFASWVHHVIDDPLYSELPVVEAVAESDSVDLPTIDEILNCERTPDLQRIGSLPTADLVRLYEEAPDPILASYLERRSHPLVVEPERVELDALVPIESAFFRPRDLFRPDDRGVPSAESARLSSMQIFDVGERCDLQATSIARALVRSGYPDMAVDYLNDRRDQQPNTNLYLLYAIAEINTPRAWEVLDEAVLIPHRPTNVVGLEAAARTESPMLAPRAAGLLVGDELDELTALLALELQPTFAAADALLEAWRGLYHLGALRALARRRDERIIDDCLLLLIDPEPQVQQVAAEALRDLRQSSTIPSLLGALEIAEDGGLVVVLAHTLAMLQAPNAASLLREKTRGTGDEALTGLLLRWADQLGATKPGALPTEGRSIEERRPEADE